MVEPGFKPGSFQLPILHASPSPRDTDERHGTFNDTIQVGLDSYTNKVFHQHQILTTVPISTTTLSGNIQLWLFRIGYYVRFRFNLKIFISVHIFFLLLSDSSIVWHTTWVSKYKSLLTQSRLGLSYVKGFSILLNYELLKVKYSI